LFFFSSRRRHTRSYGDWSSDVCSSDLAVLEWTSEEAVVSSLMLLTGASFEECHRIRVDCPRDVVGTWQDGSATKTGPIRIDVVRSEERRVGKEWRVGWERENRDKRPHA